MNELITRYKYPRTPHLPFSEGMTNDDKMASASALTYLQSGIDLVVTEKLDGGNVSLYPDYFHARSLDSGTHAWDTLAKRIWSQIRFDIPTGWRITGESLQARRSVAYDSLTGPLYIFGIWDESNNLLSFDDMTEFASLLELPVVPTLYRGTNYKEATQAWSTKLNADVSEGFVLRDAGTIPYSNFGQHVAKFVRANHVQTDASWRGRDDFALNGFTSTLS